VVPLRTCQSTKPVILNSQGQVIYEITKNSKPKAGNQAKPNFVNYFPVKYRIIKGDQKCKKADRHFEIKIGANSPTPKLRNNKDDQRCGKPIVNSKPKPTNLRHQFDGKTNNSSTSIRNQTKHTFNSKTNSIAS